MDSSCDRGIRFEIVEKLGVIATHPTGWTKELNLVSWNGAAPKLDIRDWSPGHERMSRGITLHQGEGKKTARLILAYLDAEDGGGFQEKQEGFIAG